MKAKAFPGLLSYASFLAHISPDSSVAAALPGTSQQGRTAILLTSDQDLRL